MGGNFRRQMFRGVGGGGIVVGGGIRTTTEVGREWRSIESSVHIVGSIVGFQWMRIKSSQLAALVVILAADYKREGEKSWLNFFPPKSIDGSFY